LRASLTPGGPTIATVLVVEDDPDVALLLRLALDRAGHAVWVEGDGECGLAAATRLKPDVVLTDWMLPHRSGVELCQAIRRDPALSDTAVILVTARDRECDREWAYAAGVDCYVAKPFVTAQLVSSVETALHRRLAPES